jgi:hypothetical protein
MKKKFIKGPIPLAWLDQVLLTGGRGLNVALAIWYQVGLKKSNTITLPRTTTRLFRVTRNNVWRALKRMEETRLIFVTRRKGRLSHITVLDFQNGEVNHNDQ